MSRVLKFRAWDKKKNRWAREWDRELEDQEDQAYENEYSEDSHWLDGDVASDLDLVNGRLSLDRYIWEQYTEGTDKNGKEIYEGDILDTPGGRCLCVWNGDGWTYQFKVHRTDWFDIVKEFHKNSEVIGNIHENPELIGGEE